jgi:hypothetical protein
LHQTERSKAVSLPQTNIKSRDGHRWYVGLTPMRSEADPCSQLGSYIYAASAWAAEENKRKAEAYARAIQVSHPGSTIVDQGALCRADEPPRDVTYDCDPIADQRTDASDFEDVEFPF